MTAATTNSGQGRDRGTGAGERRAVVCVMGAGSLRYAKACLASLIRNVAEPIELIVVTDGDKDVAAISAALAEVDAPRHSAWSVVGKAAVDAIAEERLAGQPAVRRFRNGHPCWRKITDPALVVAEGRPVVIIDPDVYFPNRFTFEPAPARGVLLMWQGPNCLLPQEVVETAFERQVALADHTDIGVAQVRGIDWAYLETLLVELGDAALPTWSMHVESIVWAALAMREGGGYFDPTAWHCFANSVSVRLRRKMGRDGVAMLRDLNLQSAKCLHAGGVAKNWLVDAERAGLFDHPADLTAPTPVRPYQPFTRQKFDRKFRLRAVAAKLGLYKLLAQ